MEAVPSLEVVEKSVIKEHVDLMAQLNREQLQYDLSYTYYPKGEVK